MGTSRRYPYCIAHKLPLHKCAECSSKLLPPGSLNFSPIRGDKPKCTAHNLCLERCNECKELLYNILSQCTEEEYLSVCDKIVQPKRSFSAATLPPISLISTPSVGGGPSAGAGNPLPPTPIETNFFAPFSDEMNKKPRLERATFYKRTFPELFTTKELERKRKEIKRQAHKTKSAANLAFSQYALPCKEGPQKYQLYVEIEYTYNVRQSYKLIDLDGKDAYLRNYSPQRRNAVIALCRAVSEGLHRTKHLSEKTIEAIEMQTKRDNLYAKSVVDLISWSWLFFKYAIPFITKWKRIVNQLAQSGTLQAERQALFFKVQEHMGRPPVSPPNTELVTAAGNFEPITPEKSDDTSSCPQQPLPCDVFNDSSISDLCWMDAIVNPLTDKFDEEAEKAHVACFVPTYEACGYKRPRQLRIPGKRVTVTSSTTMIVDSSSLSQISPGMQFFRYSKTFEVVSIESKTITFKCTKQGPVTESLWIGKMSDARPNLNNLSVLFREKPSEAEGSEHVLGTFQSLAAKAQSSVLTDQISRFVSV